MLKLKSFAKKIITVIAVVGLTVAYIPTTAFAAQITGRSVTIGSSAASAVTTYSFTFSVPSATAIKSVDFQSCASLTSCTTPTGFLNSSSTLTAQPTGLGAASGWTVNTATAGDLRLSDSSNSTAPSGSQTVSFSNVTNPSATNATFFFKITTYSDAAWTTAIDTGNVATSTAGQITVTASINEALTFTLSTATVALGTLTTATTGAQTTTMSASTNAGTGYSITYTGTTLTSGSNTIAALASPTASTVNTAQFGFNLMANTTPSIGAGVSGSGSGTAASGYNTANSFKFNSGDTIASASLPTNSNTYTASYIANISPVTPPGAYSTVLNYVATANF